MVRIVNGEIRDDKDIESAPASTSSPASAPSGNEEGYLSRINTFFEERGIKLRYLFLIAAVTLLFFGFKGLLILALIGGLAVALKRPSTAQPNSSAPATSSGGGRTNVRGVGDYSRPSS
mmetsp:Transcript_1416/g.2508  ORF Transcript_1416/g.2508 Transcript_1416/m.2508 type:complete len:119 (-) Transcript_1416:153-509(-)